MKKPVDFSLVCYLLCAAGSLWFAVAELLDGAAGASRRTVHVFLWFTVCALNIANLVVALSVRKNRPETENIELEEDNFHE